MISNFINWTYDNAQTNREQYPSIPINSEGGDPRTVVLTRLESQLSFFGSVLIKNNTINVGLFPSASTFYSISITQNIILDLKPSSQSFFDSVLVKNNTINMGTLQSTGVFYNISVTPGAVNLTLNQLASTLQFYSAQIAPSSDIALTLLQSSAAFFTAAVSLENLIDAELFESQIVFYSITVDTRADGGSDLLLLGVG